MVSFSFTNLRNLKNTSKFLFVAIFITGMFFSGLCRAEESVAEKEYMAQRKFLQMQASVDNEDYLRAKFVLNDFKSEYSGTNFYKKYSKKINSLAKAIRKNTKNIKFEDKIEYLFIPPRLETKQWKEYMSTAESIISRDYNKKSGTGISVLHVIFEDESLEHPLAKTDWNSNNEISIYGTGGGYSNVNYQNWEQVFVGSGFRRYRTSDSNKKNISAFGDVIIGGIYHYPTKLKIEVKRGKAIAYGEVFVRTIPKEYCGNLKVNVVTEEGLQLAGAAVRLKVSGFVSGKTQPLKGGSCLFSSIGPGKYSVGLAKNDIFEGPDQSAVVVTGQTSEVTIMAYRRRMIEFDWRFRRTDGPYNWLSGRKTMKTDESWQPDDEWPDVHYPVIAFTGWTGDACTIRSSNGDLMLIVADESFKKMDFPSNFNSYSHNYTVKEGDVFAWRREDREQKGNFLQALINIRKITPVGLPQDQNSSEQENMVTPSCQVPMK